MILTTTETAPGHRVVAVKGLVQGNTIRARHIGRDIMAGLRNIVGGEISEYTRLMTESRMQSTHRMIEEAEALGANAVVGVRFVTSMVISGASELAYGTAVVVEDEPGEQTADEAPGEDEASSQDEGDEPSASAAQPSSSRTNPGSKPPTRPKTRTRSRARQAKTRARSPARRAKTRARSRARPRRKPKTRAMSPARQAKMRARSRARPRRKPKTRAMSLRGRPPRASSRASCGTPRSRPGAWSSPVART